MSLKFLGLGALSLECLSISMNSNITNDGLDVLGSPFHNYKALDFSFCTKISDYGVMSLFRTPNRLEMISFRYCKLLTDGCISVIVRNSPVLKVLDLFGCPHVTGLFCKTLAPNVRVITSPTKLSLTKFKRRTFELPLKDVYFSGYHKEHRANRPDRINSKESSYME
jgi:hypothetical protein